MKLKRLKAIPADFLDGVTIETETRDGSNSALTITDKNGRFLKIAIESYSMCVYEKQPPEFEKRWVVRGKLLGEIDYYREFDDSYDARKHLQKLAADCGKEEEAIGLEAVEIEVEVAE